MFGKLSRRKMSSSITISINTNPSTNNTFADMLSRIKRPKMSKTITNMLPGF